MFKKQKTKRKCSPSNATGFFHWVIPWLNKLHNFLWNVFCCKCWFLHSLVGKLKKLCCSSSSYANVPSGWIPWPFGMCGICPFHPHTWLPLRDYFMSLSEPICRCQHTSIRQVGFGHAGARQKGWGETCREKLACTERERHTDRQTDRQTDTDRERERQTDRQHTYKGRELDLAAPLPVLCQPDIRGH